MHQSVSTATLYYDGECALCQRVVKFVVRRDKRKYFSVKPLQDGMDGRSCTIEGSFDSMVVETPAGQRLERSDAVFYVLSHLSTFWRVLLPLRFLPRSWRDGLYNLVARHRFKFFGRC